MERPLQQLPPWQRPRQQQGPSHPHPLLPLPRPLPLLGRRPLRPYLPSPPRGPALPPSPRKSLQSQQRTRKGINCSWSSPSALAPGDHLPCRPGLLTSLPVALSLDRSGWGGGRHPLGPGPSVWCGGWGRSGHVVCGGAICLSVCSCALAILPCQPSTIGNHGEADAALPRGGPGWGEARALCGMPAAIHRLVPHP